MHVLEQSVVSYNVSFSEKNGKVEAMVPDSSNRANLTFFDSSHDVAERTGSSLQKTPKHGMYINVGHLVARSTLS